MKYPFDIEKLRAVLLATNDWTQFEGPGRHESKDGVIVFEYPSDPPDGDFFLCDCIGNTVDLCLKTKRKFKNSEGRMVNCKVLETIIKDARKQLGSPVNNCWKIPYHLI